MIRTMCIILSCLAITLLGQNLQATNFNEEFGVEIVEQSNIKFNKLSWTRPIVNWQTGVLMTPVSGESLGLFDPYDGNYLGSLCYIGTNTPINAVQGPDNNIYISYQVGDKVEMFDTLGNYLGVYATAANGLDNTRGIAFRDSHLFITNGSPALKTIEMSGPNTVHRIFIQDGSDPFDIWFFPNGKSLVSDIAGTTDNVRIYDTNGIYIRNIFSINFPEQIQDDPAYPGRFMVAGFSTNNIQLFDTTGVVYRTYALSGARGVYRLGNGNILGTNGTAVYSIDSASGAATIKRSGQGRFIELYRLSGAGISDGINNQYLVKVENIYPNPFNKQTVIQYQLNQATPITVKIYNCLGQEVKTLVNHYQTPNSYQLIWDGKDNFGKTVANGIYTIKINTPYQSKHLQLILVK